MRPKRDNTPASKGAAPQKLPGTGLLEWAGDRAALMVAGIDRCLEEETERRAAQRAARWQRSYSSPESYVDSVEPNRQRLRAMLGLSEGRLSPDLRVESPPGEPAEIARGNGYRISAVRWSALTGADGEGLLLSPYRRPVADVVALPDCDWTPEMLVGLAPGVPETARFAARLAENGCRVLVPALIDRRDTHAGVPQVRMTNQPHREFIHRGAWEMGRTLIGLEVETVLAAIDWLEQTGQGPIGIAGYGEGGLVAFYAAAVDRRIHTALVSGYFQPREKLWTEPIYRCLFGLLAEFGDAEIASLIVPRRLVIEAARHPDVPGPPQTPGRSGAAPGRLSTPAMADVDAEIRKASELAGPFAESITRIQPDDGLPGSEGALRAFLSGLGRSRPLRPAGPVRAVRPGPDPGARLERQFHGFLDHIQHLVREAPYRRQEFWAQADPSSLERWKETTQAYRDLFWDRVIGRLPPASAPVNPRTRLLYETPHFRGYEVTLDVYPTVFAAGILLVPKDAMPGEQRPVVVCQHGLEGRPEDNADPAVDNQYYHQFACRLAEEGFVTYSSQNPYIGGDTFRVLLRKARPLGLTLFSIIVRQHERTLEWLSSLPFVDPARIAFYGLSYGGTSAMRIPAVLQQYCLSICSANFNEWIWKTTSTRSHYSYLLTGEYDMPEWNLGETFNYAEMSWLIAPRPFMVERGHTDMVAPDEWVAYEYARTLRQYDLLGIGDRTAMETFIGGHEINGEGTFEFLRRHLSHG